MGLVNDAMGTVHAICYKGQAPPYSCHCYSGPTMFSDGTLPITPLRRSWSPSGSSMVQANIPLTPNTQAHYQRIDEEFDHVLHHPAEVMRIGNG